MAVVVIVVGVLLIAGTCAWFVLQRQNPQHAASSSRPSPRDEAEQTDSSEFYDTVDRPAGPDAEPMDPRDLGGDQRPPGVSG